MGPIEDGVRKEERRKALENLAITLAEQLDNGVEQKNLAAISRELRLTLAELSELGQSEETDKVGALISKHDPA